MSPRRPTVALLFCIFLSRSLSDTRLAPVLLFRIFRSRSLSDTRLAPVLLFCSFRSRRHSDPRLAPSIYLCLIALVNLFMCFMFTFVISYVWTVLRVLSKYSLACWFGQMLTKAISWMKSSIASPTLRGVPVSLVRPWIWSLFYIRFRYQINSSSLTSTLDEMTDLESCISLPAVFLHHRPILESVVCLHTTVSCPPLCIIIGVLVIIWLSDRSSTL